MALDTEKANQILEELRSKVLNEVEINKVDFLEFRKVLIEQPDFKNFHGIAQQGGSTKFEYIDTPRV